MVALFVIAFGYFALLPMTDDPPPVTMSSKSIPHKASSRILKLKCASRLTLYYPEYNACLFR